jgi:uncharacterized membrane protein YtjA (UPF0391 family)
MVLRTDWRIVYIWHIVCSLIPGQVRNGRQSALGSPVNQPNRRIDMFGWALIFLIVALIAGAVGLTGIAGAASNIAWILFVVGLIVAAVLFFRRRV